jgi:hypothetical protein
MKAYRTELTRWDRKVLAAEVSTMTKLKLSDGEVPVMSQVALTVSCGNDTRLASVPRGSLGVGTDAHRPPRARKVPISHAVLFGLYKRRPTRPRALCAHKAITGVDTDAISARAQSPASAPWTDSTTPRHISEIGMGFRGWGVDYDGIRLPNQHEQRMMICAHCGVFGHSVHFCRARPIRGSGNTYADLHDLCMLRLLHERGR